MLSLLNDVLRHTMVIYFILFMPNVSVIPTGDEAMSGATLFYHTGALAHSGHRKCHSVVLHEPSVE